VLNVIGKMCLCVNSEKSASSREKETGERGKKHRIDIFSRAIFDYVESRFIVSQFCSKETAATFTNGS